MLAERVAHEATLRVVHKWGGGWEALRVYTMDCRGSCCPSRWGRRRRTAHQEERKISARIEGVGHLDPVDMVGSRRSINQAGFRGRASRRARKQAVHR